MAMSRVQYQAGLPMIEFFEKYGSHAQYEEVVKAWTKTRAIAATTLALGVFVIASRFGGEAPQGGDYLWLTTKGVAGCAFTISVSWQGYDRATTLEVFVAEGYDGDKLVPSYVRIDPNYCSR